jgi:hypothetical protein
MFLRLALSVCLLAPAATFAETAYAVDSRSLLISFDTNVPSFINSVNLIRGLQPGEGILAIDFRPANKKLYGLGSTSRLYVIDTETGAATAVGSGPFTPAIDGTEFGFDFNPTVDRIRLVSNRGQNLRLHPDTGMVAATDRPVNYADGTAPSIVASAYTNSVAGATTTTLYNIDSKRLALVTQNPPNDGVLNMVGALVNFDTSDLAGFDISNTNNNLGYAAMREAKSNRSVLRGIHLSTGDHYLIGLIGPFEQISGFAIAIN